MGVAHRGGVLRGKNGSIGEGSFLSIGGGVPILGSSSQKHGFYVEIRLKYLRLSSLAPTALAILEIYILARDVIKNKRLAQYPYFRLKLAFLSELHRFTAVKSYEVLF